MTTDKRTATQDLTRTSAVELQRLIASREVSARECVEAHVRRIEEVDARLNAVVLKRFEQALVEADEVDNALARGATPRALEGVPFTVKESFDVAGLPTTMGLSARAKVLAEKDSPTVARLRAAGAILLGKTNVPQLLMINEADNPVYGRTNNPWNVERATGGSSGGCAAAVAAHCAPFSIGSDIGGSVRLPAHACGVHSLKPTSRRLTLEGHTVIFPNQTAVVAQPGPLARRVEDVRLVYELLAREGQHDSDVTPAPVRDSSELSIENLRVGFYTDNGVMRPAPSIRRAVEEAARALAARGAHVEEWTPPDVSEAWGVFQELMFSDGMADARLQLKGSRRDWRITIITLSGMWPRALRRVGAWEMSLLGQKHWAEALRHVGRRSHEEYERCAERQRRYREKFFTAWDARGLDAVVCPVEALPAYTHGASIFVADSLSHTSLYNFLGAPAGVVAATRVRAGEESDRAPSFDVAERIARKIERGSAGLPVGVQIAARHWREDIVLKVMSALEEHFGEVTSDK